MRSLLAAGRAMDSSDPHSSSAHAMEEDGEQSDLTLGTPITSASASSSDPLSLSAAARASKRLGVPLPASWHGSADDAAMMAFGMGDVDIGDDYMYEAEAEGGCDDEDADAIAAVASAEFCGEDEEDDQLDEAAAGFSGAAAFSGASASAAETSLNSTLGLTHSEDCDITSLGLMDWTKFAQWVTCICVVEFDLELGQSLEMVYPANHPLTPAEMKNVCYLAFPDSNSGCMGNHQFNFRIRAPKQNRPGGEIGSAAASAASAGGEDGRADSAAARRASRSSVGAASSQSGDTGSRKSSYYYGSVLFRQIPDATSRRGYFQKSVVVVSRRFHVGLYAEVASRVALAFFEHGRSALESACQDICRWPPPEPNTSVRLKLLGATLLARVPDPQPGVLPRSRSSWTEKNSGKVSGVQELHTSLEPASLFQTLRPLLSNLQALWEMVLTAEPILVISPTPTICSNAVLALVGLVGTSIYQGDFRPFFTIHDPDCPRVTKKANKPAGMILGVTNPYFSTALEHWPHVVRVGLLHLSRTTSSGTAGNKSPPTIGSRIFGKQGLFSSYKPKLETAKAFMKPILKPPPGPAQDPSQLGERIRTHFVELTQQFLIPLEQYVARLMPLKSSISPFKSVPKMPNFSARDFIKGLSSSLPQLQRTRKGSWLSLYASFLKSPNFRVWWAARQKVANAELIKLYLDLILTTNLEAWAREQDELKVIDLYMRINDALATAQKAELLPPQTLRAVRDKTEGVVEILPPDLRASLQMRQRQG